MFAGDDSNEYLYNLGFDARNLTLMYANSKGADQPARRAVLSASMVFAFYNWASAQESLSSEVCEQHGRRPACASAQSDQRLCYWRSVKYHI